LSPVATASMSRPAGDSVERILAAAEKLFAEFGFDAVSMSDIAQHAGVSKSNVFHHFSSKGELYVAVLNAAHRDFSALVDRLADDSGTFRQRIGHFAQEHLRCILEQHQASRLVLRDLLENDTQRGRELAEKVFGANFASLVGIIRASQERKELRIGVDPAMVAVMLIAANVFFFQAHGVFKHFPDVAFADDAPCYGDMLVDILLPGILPPDKGKA